MSDCEMEKFEITDYDLDNEFNMNRPRRKMSKKQQMLGNLLTSTYFCFTYFHIRTIIMKKKMIKLNACGETSKKHCAT